MNNSLLNVLVASIISNLNAGNADGAIAGCISALKQLGNNAALYDYYAKALALKGDLPAAVDAQQKAIQFGSATIIRVLYFGELLLLNGEWQQAADVFQQVINSDAKSFSAWLGLGHCLLMSKDYAQAEKCYASAAANNLGNALALSRVAMCKLKQGDVSNALALLRGIAEPKEMADEVTYLTAVALQQSGQIAEAEALFSSLRDNPQWGDVAARGLVMIGLSLEKFDQASALLKPLLDASPDDHDLLIYQARLHMVNGKTGEASELLQQLIDQRCENPVAWEMHAENMDAPFDEAHLDTLLHLKETLIDPNGKAACLFALARHDALLKDYAGELAALTAANDLLAAQSGFDPAAHAASVRALRECYSADDIARLSSSDQSFSPVFILCPPRSGSTLLEQALARHSQCQSGGEKAFADSAWYSLTGGRNVTMTAAERHASLTKQEVRQFKQAYMAGVDDAGLTHTKVMVHKGISGHKFAGLLKAAFPCARFIELTRAPLDVAFGCYRQHFESQPFSNTFAGCAAEIALFQDNMRWWRKQMGGAIYPITYRDLVVDFEATLKALVKWLGLDWEPDCLDFAAVAQVGTASINQVRQGVFTHGLGRWKKYGKLLLPLQEALAVQGVASG